MSSTSGRGASRERLCEAPGRVGPRFAVHRRSATGRRGGPRGARRIDVDLGCALFPRVLLLCVLPLCVLPLWGCASKTASPRTHPEIAQESAHDRAAESESPVVLRWSTATEFERYGYHVYRGADPDGPFERLTDESIPAAGSTDLPQHYRFEDRTARPGSVYFYFVESVSTSGERERFTPVRPFVAGKGETSS